MASTRTDWTRAEILAGLHESPAFVYRALQVMYARQTDDEQAAGVTAHDNGVGFNGTDAEFLSSVAERSKPYGKLTTRQCDAVRRALVKYVGQLVAAANSGEIAAATGQEG